MDDEGRKDSHRRFALIHKALGEISGMHQGEHPIGVAERSRYLLISSYGLTPSTPEESENWVSVFKRELAYSEACLDGLGMSGRDPMRRVEMIRKGDPVGLEALIDIEYGIPWKPDHQVGPPWLMGAWREMAKLVSFLCNIGSGNYQNKASSFKPEDTLRLWPLEKMSRRAQWAMGNGKDGYFVRATIGLTDAVECALCGSSEDPLKWDFNDEIKCGQNCDIEAGFSTGDIELESFSASYVGKNWIAFREGPKALVDRKGKVPRLLWESIQDHPRRFDEMKSISDEVLEEMVLDEMEPESWRERHGVMRERRRMVKDWSEDFDGADFSRSASLLLSSGEQVPLKELREGIAWVSVPTTRCVRDSQHQEELMRRMQGNYRPLRWFKAPNFPMKSPLYPSSITDDERKITRDGMKQMKWMLSGYCGPCGGFYWRDSRTDPGEWFFDDGEMTEKRRK